MGWHFPFALRLPTESDSTVMVELRIFCSSDIRIEEKKSVARYVMFIKMTVAITLTTVLILTRDYYDSITASCDSENRHLGFSSQNAFPAETKTRQRVCSKQKMLESCPFRLILEKDTPETVTSQTLLVNYAGYLRASD
jgi:hypothetical protein